MNLALFDLDNTLLACDSDYEWGQFLVDRGGLKREEYEAQNAAFYEQYKAGTLDIHEFLGFALRPLAEHTPADLERWHADFMASRIRPAMSAPARALVGLVLLGAKILCADRPIRHARRDRAESAAAPGGDRAGSGRVALTGRVAGTCFREGKIARVNALAGRAGAQTGDFPRSTFYSDSHNDLPLLELVTHPVAVDPDPAGRRARARAGPWFP
jgi:phosphoserine phosphatase